MGALVLNARVLTSLLVPLMVMVMLGLLRATPQCARMPTRSDTMILIGVPHSTVEPCTPDHARHKLLSFIRGHTESRQVLRKCVSE